MRYFQDNSKLSRLPGIFFAITLPLLLLLNLISLLRGTG